MRLDLFLKQTTLIKRRTIAKELAEKGRVLINNKVAKPSSEVKDGDTLVLTLGNRRLEVKASITLKGTREIASVSETKTEKINEN